jgi:ELWxxDGT repeat protein
MFSHLTRRLLATTTSPRKLTASGRKKSRVRLHVEDLEGKLLMTSVPLNFGATVTARSAPVAVGSELFFTADDATRGNQVWETNGTVAGTIPLSSAHEVNGINGGIFPADLTVVGSEVYFSATDFSHGYQIWETNGTAAGTQMVSANNPYGGGIFPADLTAVGSELYFVGYDPTDGEQLFESNGTAAGTQIVADIPGANGYPGSYPTDLTAAGGLLYFAATDATHGTQLWSANPTTGAVTMLTSGNAKGGGTVPQFITAVGSTAYFSGFDLTNHEQLWASAGTAATTERLTSGNSSQGGVNPQFLTAAGNSLYYSANDGVHGTQLWSMTGTTPGAAVMLTSANVSGGGVAPTNLGAVGSEVYFSGNDGVHNAQLWSSNGTTGGTGMVADIDGTATANVASPTNVNGTLFFTAYTLSGGYQVWQSNGTSAGTVADTSLNTGGSAVPSALTAAGNNLYFTSPGATLWEWQTATQATPTVTWTSPAGIVYGTPLSSSQLDATASVPGTFTYSPALGTVLGAGTDTLSLTFNPTDSTDYKSATATTTIAVAQATPTLSWTSPAGIVYGTALSTAQLDATASVAGTFTYSPALGTVLGAGTDTLSLTFNPTDSTDYKGVTTTTTIAVAQATPGVVWPSPASIVYGTALSSAQLDATASVPGTFAYSPAAGTVLGVGNNQMLSVTFTPTDSTDYKKTTAATTINVLPAPTAGATFLTKDTKTQGTWIGTYGGQGYDVIDGSSSLPSYATVTPSGQSNYVWASSTTDARALQTSGGSSRIAATWFSTTSFTVDVNLTDGKVHDLELYFLDWDNWGRSEQVQISNASTGAVLSTQSISSFQSGAYLDYAVSGNILITFTNQGTKNAVLSGLFIDPAS